MVKKFDIVTYRQYEKDGVTKKNWQNVGQLVRFEATDMKPERFIIELSMFPDTEFLVFERDKGGESTKVEQQVTDDIDPDSILF